MFDRITKPLRSIFPGGMVGNSRRSKQNSLLRILSVAHSQRLDPKTLIENLSAEYPGRYGQKLRLLQRWLAADSSISAAIAHTPGVLDEDDTLALQCGIETNTLDETLQFLLQHTERDDQSIASDLIRGMAGYVIGVLIFAMIVTTFLMIFIVPTLSQIFEEFALELPMAMSALIEFSELGATLVPLALLALIGSAVLLLFEDVRRAIRRSPLGRMMPTVARRQSAGLLRLLALPTSLGQPIGPTLTAAAQFHPNQRWRKRLLLARTGAVSESDIWRQLADQRLIARLQGEQLGNIENASLRAWTLVTLADRDRQLANQKTESIARVFQHVPTIILGIFVGWIVIAVMQTLTNLASSLA